jgi:hypothetical protein
VTTAILNLTFEGNRTEYAPGETLAVEYFLGDACDADMQALEISVLWFTEGKGDEDLAVHYFERIESNGGTSTDFQQPRRLSTVLPNSPLSYDGVIVKIHWCVRVRAFLTRGKELVEERSFRLGRIPSAKAILS